MKRLHQALLLGMSLGLAHLVIAEPFKEQSEGMASSAYLSGSGTNITTATLPDHFKKQSEEVGIILNPDPSQCAVTSSQWAPSSGANSSSNRFNDSSNNLC